VSTNVRPCQKSRGNECPWERMSVHHIDDPMSYPFKNPIFFALINEVTD